MTIIPLQRLYRANVVVHDLRATALGYAQIFGIARWKIRHLRPERLSERQAYGYRSDFVYSTATGHNTQGVTFRLVQPTHGFSTFTEYLITRGEGIHSICATQLDASHIGSFGAALQEHGLAVAQAATFDDGSRSLWIDTRGVLGGFYLEVTSGKDGPADEEWDFSAEVQLPPGLDWLSRIPRIGHFGVAVTSVIDKLPHYARLLGVDRWSGIHFHAAPGSLEYSTFLGQQVDNAWLLAIADVADFGLELLQGTREPTDYHETVQRSGEGVHHVLVRRDVSEDEWSTLRAWTESQKIGVVMSGRVRTGAAEFFYLDTRSALGGYLLEVIVTRDAIASAPQADPLGRFVFDFSNRAC